MRLTTVGSEPGRDEVILVARILLLLLFVIFGWGKLNGFVETTGYMAQIGSPLPQASALAAIAVELVLSTVLALGAWTRPLALLLALYSLVTGFLGHPYWAMTGVARFDGEINFYKNVAIVGGFLLLYVTGPGRYSVDSILGARRRAALLPLR